MPELRQWLILAARMLAIAGLAFAISRPLAGGWLGLTAGGRADTTILILDRSPSMQQAGAGSGSSKLETGRRQLVETLQTARLDPLGPDRQRDEQAARAGVDRRPADLTRSRPHGRPADLPAMLQAARDYIEANHSGQTDIWICSDLRENDWDADGGRWQALRDAFLEFAAADAVPPARLPADGARQPLGARHRRQAAGDRRRRRAAGLAPAGAARGWASRRATVPVQFEIDGARSEVIVEMAGREAELKDHRIPLEKGRARGWGKVSIPADANPADNAFWFVFDRPRPRLAVVVAENPEAARPLQLAASIAPDPALQCSAEVVAAEQLTSVEWEKVALLLWQAPLPEGERGQAGPGRSSNAAAG